MNSITKIQTTFFKTSYILPLYLYVQTLSMLLIT